MTLAQRIGLMVIGLYSVSFSTAHAVLPADVYGALPEVTQARISPDGHHVAMLQPVSGAASVVVYTPGGGHCAFAPSDVKIEGIRWANSEQIYVDVSTVTIPFFHLNEYKPRQWFRSILIKSDCTSPRLVLGPSLGQVNAGGGNTDYLGPVPGDDKHVFIGSYDYQGGGYEVYKMDLATGLGELTYTTGSNVGLLQQGGNLRPSGTVIVGVLLDQTGALRVRVQYNSGGDLRIFARIAGSDSWEEVYHFNDKLSEAKLRGMEFEGFGDDPNLVYVLGRNGGDRVMAYTFDLKTKQLSQPLVDPGKFEVEGYAFESYTHRVIGVDVKTLTGTTTHWLDHHWDQVFADLRATFEGDNILMTSETRDFKKLTVYVSGPSNPAGDYYLVDLSIPEADKIGSAYPRITPADLAPFKSISYKARDGLEIPAFVTLPPGSTGKNLPLVVLPHGGPEARDEPAYFDWLSQFVATRGYAVLQPEFRGSRGFGQVFMEAGHYQWGLAMQNDISDGVKYLIDQGVADPHKVAIFGWSYGGYAAMAGMTFTPELYKCGVEVAGVSDLITMLGYEVNHYNMHFDSEYSYWPGVIGDPTRDGERLRATSPALHADKVMAPMLLIHGVNDTTVPIEQSEEMAQALAKAGKHYEFVKIDGDDHHMYHAANRKAVLQAIEPFLATCLR